MNFCSYVCVLMGFALFAFCLFADAVNVAGQVASPTAALKAAGEYTCCVASCIIKRMT